MKLLKDIVTETELERLASRSNLRLGKQWAKDADFKTIKQNVFNRVSEVKHKQGKPQTVELMSTNKGFRWKCTCTAKKDYFCEHCVALGLKMMEERQPSEE